LNLEQLKGIGKHLENSKRFNGPSPGEQLSGLCRIGPARPVNTPTRPKSPLRAPESLVASASASVPEPRSDRALAEVPTVKPPFRPGRHVGPYRCRPRAVRTVAHSARQGASQPHRRRGGSTPPARHCSAQRTPRRLPTASTPRRVNAARAALFRLNAAHLHADHLPVLSGLKASAAPCTPPSSRQHAPKGVAPFPILPRPPNGRLCSPLPCSPLAPPVAVDPGFSSASKVSRRPEKSPKIPSRLAGAVRSSCPEAATGDKPPLAQPVPADTSPRTARPPDSFPRRQPDPSTAPSPCRRRASPDEVRCRGQPPR
jgi:hypothetical protein